MQSLSALCDLLFELSNLRYLSSAGIRIFYLASRRVSQNGKRMFFSGPNYDIMRIFEMIELQEDFMIFPDVESALKKM